MDTHNNTSRSHPFVYCLLQKVVRQSFQEVFKALESHKASQISLWDRFQAMEPQLQRYTVDSAGGGGDARDSIRTEELSSAIEETSRHLYRNDEHLVKLAKRVESTEHYDTLLWKLKRLHETVFSPSI